MSFIEIYIGTDSTGKRLAVRLKRGAHELWLFANDSVPELVLAAARGELQTALSHQIEGIRKNAYKAGCVDGRGKKRRKTEFSCNWSSDFGAW